MSPWRYICPYAPSAVLTASAVPLGFTAGWAAASAVAVMAVISLVSIHRLMHRIHSLDQQKHLLEEQIVRANKLSTVDELSAGIAHEINNPLAIMAQEAQWIHHLLTNSGLRDVKEAAECEDSAAEISLQVNRCKEIVHKLLSLARQMEPVYQCIDVNGLIDNITGLVEREAVPRNIEITKALQPDLPLVYTDPPLLRQVILNLLMNACQAVDRDGAVCISTLSEDGYARISVSDSGCGIPQEILSKIFTPFFSTKPEGKGSGLGLAICRGIIERMGGHISVSSVEGAPTTFTIHLPVDNRPQELPSSHKRLSSGSHT
jgi:two-component system, NtrC family, sensor kinase